MGTGELKHDCKASIRVRLERLTSPRPASIITSCAAFGKNMKPPFSEAKTPGSLKAHVGEYTERSEGGRGGKKRTR